MQKNQMNKTIGVVGAGVMGRGVTLALIIRGYDVILADIKSNILDTAMCEIEHFGRLLPLMDQNLPQITKDDLIGRIQPTINLEDIKTAEFIIENTTEKWETKQAVYQRLEAICPEHVCFGVNTSAIPITRVAENTNRPSQVVGLHFMNPVPLKPTAEVIRGLHTSEDTIGQTLALLKSMEIEGIVINDSPGFVTNRVMMLTVNEAISLLHESVAPAADIDALFTQCFGHKMGPLATADLIGLDTVLLSLEVLFNNFKDSKFKPSQLLVSMVDAGLLGCKSGEGFFQYNRA